MKTAPLRRAVRDRGTGKPEAPPRPASPAKPMVPRKRRPEPTPEWTQRPDPPAVEVETDNLNREVISMQTICVNSFKLTLVFRPGQLPPLDPDHPEFELILGSLQVTVQVSPKQARKANAHRHGHVLQGRLIEREGRLLLDQPGFTPLQPVDEVEVTAR
jgi:hypothetical protein